MVAETNQQRTAASAAKAGTRSSIQRIERQINRLVDAIVDGADALPLIAKLKKLEAEKNRLKAEVEVAAEEKPLLHPPMAHSYRDRVAALAQALYDDQAGRRRSSDLGHWSQKSG